MDKKYYWLKLKKDFFKRHDIQIIESMPNGKDYILFYLKLLVESVDHEGNLRFNDTIPYSETMLSTITNTNIDITRSAMKVFTELNMIEVLEDKTIFMTEVNKMLGSETYWAEQKRKKRLDVGQCPENVQSVQVMSKQEIDIEKEIDIEIDNNKLGAEAPSQFETDALFRQKPCVMLKDGSEPPVIKLILKDKSFYPITQSQINKWIELYPAVDVDQELLKMVGWCEANTHKRKTAKGIPRFINGWLSRQQDQQKQQKNKASSSLDILSQMYEEVMQNDESGNNPANSYD